MQTTTKPQHKPTTPLPWTDNGTQVHGRDINPNGSMSGAIRVFGIQTNYAYIAHACNAYPKLVEALKLSGHAKPLLQELGEL
jgi:hypothetical protein